MQPLIWDRRPDGLRAPALVCAFRGWNDAADSASTALTFIGAQLRAERFARIDPEEFFDFQATRPQTKIVEGRHRELTWPETELYEVRIPRAPRDLVLLSGIEPSYRWRTYCRTVLDLSDALGCQMVVTLGALLSDVAHTMPVQVTGLASDEQLVEKLGLHSANYEGPTGIVGALHGAAQDAGIPAASLWAAVPHYVAAAPNPKGALALIRKLEGLVGVAVDASELEHAAEEWEHRVTIAVQSDPDVQQFVERLERAAETGEDPVADPSDLPSGDSIARDFQRFLRQRSDDD